MNDADISQYITDTFEGVDVVADSGSRFFFYNPDSNLPPDHRFPFVTIVTSDVYDQFSNLNRPSVFRLNMGIGKQTFSALRSSGAFSGSQKLPADREGAAESQDKESEYDYTILDQLMPHPVYGRMYWVSVLNPSGETFKTKVQPLLTEAYELAVSKRHRQVIRK